MEREDRERVNELYARTYVRREEGLKTLTEMLPVFVNSYAIRRLLPVIGRGVDVRESTIFGAGRGLFASRDVVAGELVTFYDGAVCDAPRDPRQLPQRFRSHAVALWKFRLLVIGNFGSYDEAREGQGGGAMINTRFDDTDFNVEFFLIDASPPLVPVDTHPELRVLGIRATRSVPAGAEFFIDYGEYYLSSLSAPVAADARLSVVWLPHGQGADYPDACAAPDVTLRLLPPYEAVVQERQRADEEMIVQRSKRRRIVPTPVLRCLACGDDTDLVCERCGIAAFCSLPCQRRGHDLHSEHVCAAIARLRTLSDRILL